MTEKVRSDLSTEERAFVLSLDQALTLALVRVARAYLELEDAQKAQALALVRFQGAVACVAVAHGIPGEARLAPDASAIEEA